MLRVGDGHHTATVSAMARLRSVSRQHVQMLVDGLRADGLVAAIPKPTHKRSVLIALTRRGEDYLRDLNRREEELWQFLGQDLSPDRIDSATQLVRTLRGRFESDEWGELVNSGSARVGDTPPETPS